MISIQFIDEISNKISRMVAESPAGDLEKNLHALLRGIFTKMELVSREEFDVQAQVLLSARAQLEALARKVDALEARARQE